MGGGRMSFSRVIGVIGFSLLLASCGNYASSTVAPVDSLGKPLPEKPVTGRAQDPDLRVGEAKATEAVLLTEGDITDRPYRAVDDIEVVVRKATIFNTDPTKEDVAKALRAKAAEIGADAVILVRYGTVGIGIASWGQMEGNGRAVVFQK